MAQTPEPGRRGLRRNLRLWQVVAVSVGLMAPSMAANINPQGSVGSIGRAIPLAFVIAAIGALLVSYGFVRLAQHFHTSGSVYGFVGATLGPRTGAVSGWSLIGTYMFLGVTAAVTGGRFVLDLLDSTGIWRHPPDWVAYAMCVVLLLAALVLAVIPTKRAADTILTFEAVTVALIVIISGIVVVKLLAGSAPTGRRFTWSVFQVHSGTHMSALGLGVVFAFLSFVGFEASATLGEEASAPRRDIPRALLGTVAIGGIFYVVVTAIEVMGFGTTGADLTSFANSTSLFGDLSRTYAAGWLGDVVTAGTAISALGCSLACTVGAGRLLYSLGRDGMGARTPLAGVTARWGTPAPATAAVTVMMLLTTVTLKLAGVSSLNAFIYTATIGTLIILMVYLTVTVGAIRLLFFSSSRAVSWAELPVPVLAMAAVGYVIWDNVHPYPKGAAAWLPVSSGAWIVVGIVTMVAFPDLARHFGAALTADEGLQPTPPELAPVFGTTRP